jgi:diguanylate cyclase (GGDEF)-like protein/PAS domain S-box-containing protein
MPFSSTSLTQVLELTALLVGVVLVSAYRTRAMRLHETMRAAFVFEFTALVLLGVPASMVVAAAGELAHARVRAWQSGQLVRTLAGVTTAVVAMQVAGGVHLLLGGNSAGRLEWPWEALPLAAAVAAYCGARITAGLVELLVSRQPIDVAWASRLLHTCPPYAIGASVAVALAEAAARGYWEILPVVALPLYVAHRAYGIHLDRLDEQHRRHEVLDSFVQGMAVVNRTGEITLWTDALERLTGCPRPRALGEKLTFAVPALGRSALPRTLEEVLRTREARTLNRIALPLAAGTRVFEVRVLPVEDGATLLWHDITDRAREEGTIRLALAAEVASEGLWEWDLRSQDCFFSGPWRAIVGLPAQAGTGSPDDWLTRVHPDDVSALKDTLKAHLAGDTPRLQHEHRIRHEDGSYRWVVCRGLALRGVGRRALRLAGSLTARTDGAIAQERIRAAGVLDPLTNLANRSVFVERLGMRLVEAKERAGGDQFAVLYLDLDRFKVVNDSLGHLVGDQLLIAVSRRLEACLRPTDLLARLGGDEFAILLSPLRDEQQANAIAFRIQESLTSPFEIGGREVFTTASIGIAIGLPQYSSPDDIMRDADTAMYHAKTRGKARHELFDADMHARVRDRLGLESDLRHAVANNDFEVHYQPIVLLATGMCVGFESLIRWKRNGEPVSPAIFIPLAEEVGLIEPLGTWVLREACRTFADWQRRYGGGLDYITVNVSSRQLGQPNFLGIVEKAVHDAKLQPSDLRLEITETALMENPKVAAGLLRDLRDFGVKIYLDDFGTGYSSLSHLHKLPVDALKIDRSFVNSLQRSDRPIVESILALARTLNTSVVAEGIETDAQALELERLGCTHAQGYLFSRPIPAAAAEALLSLNQPLGPKQQEQRGAIAPEPDHLGGSGPFRWPDTVPLRPDAVGGKPTLAHA